MFGGQFASQFEGQIRFFSRFTQRGGAKSQSAAEAAESEEKQRRAFERTGNRLWLQKAQRASDDLRSRSGAAVDQDDQRPVEAPVLADLLDVLLGRVPAGDAKRGVAAGDDVEEHAADVTDLFHYFGTV